MEKAKPVVCKLSVAAVKAPSRRYVRSYRKLIGNAGVNDSIEVAAAAATRLQQGRSIAVYTTISAPLALLSPPQYGHLIRCVRQLVSYLRRYSTTLTAMTYTEVFYWP